VSLNRATDLLFSNPGLFCRKSVARLLPRAPFFPRRAVRNIRGVRFECEFALDPRIGDMFFSAYEPDEVAVLERCLKPGDVFVDVGANIGYLTAIGASLVGRTGQVHSFEPVPAYFARLQALCEANPEYSIRANAIALGETAGTAEIAQSGDGNIGWNSMVPGMLTGESHARHTVPVQRLDAYLAEQRVSRVALIKVDAEGFELPVLRGASRFLDEAAASLPPILCEVAPGAYPLLGTKVTDLFEFLARYGYVALDVESHGRPVRVESLGTTLNVLFLPGTRSSR
jgi:FkbM family methyltransferase